MAEQLSNFFIRILKRKLKKSIINQILRSWKFQNPITLQASLPVILDQVFKILIEWQSSLFRLISISIFSLFSNERTREQRNLNNPAVEFLPSESQATLLPLWDLMHKVIFRINILRNVEEHVLKQIPTYSYIAILVSA